MPQPATTKASGWASRNRATLFATVCRKRWLAIRRMATAPQRDKGRRIAVQYTSTGWMSVGRVKNKKGSESGRVG